MGAHWFQPFQWFQSFQMSASLFVINDWNL